MEETNKKKTTNTKKTSTKKTSTSKTTSTKKKTTSNTEKKNNVKKVDTNIKTSEEKKEVVKELPKKETTKKIKNTNKVSSNDEVKNLIIILAVIVVVFMIVYFIASILSKHNKDYSSIFSSSELGTAEIQYDKILVGTLLNQSDDIYYALVEGKDDDKITTYEDTITSIREYTKYDYNIYTIDLSDALNKSSVADDASYDSTNLKFNGTTLVKVNSGEIVKAYTETSEITEVLNKLLTEAKETEGK